MKLVILVSVLRMFVNVLLSSVRKIILIRMDEVWKINWS